MYNHDTTRVDLQTLTRRELQVWYWAIRGYKNKWIAQKLVIDDKTIERHINSIYNKLRVCQSSEKGQHPRAAMTYMASRDGDFNTVTEDGEWVALRNNVYNLNEKEQLFATLLRMGHTDETIASVVRMELTDVEWYVKLLSIKYGLRNIYADVERCGRIALIERLELAGV